ncbi:MAG TPA: glycerate kinase, partial [Flavobacteriales bacterium]|nr:glycerate kinase [Flavobacteriales bacterium]
GASAVYGPQKGASPEQVTMLDAGLANLAAVIKRDLGVRHGVYLYNGTVTSPILGEAFKLPYKDLDILLAAF